MKWFPVLLTACLTAVSDSVTHSRSSSGPLIFTLSNRAQRPTVDGNPGSVLRGDRGLVVDDDGIKAVADTTATVAAGPATLAPSPSPSRAPTRIFGMGVGIFALFFFALCCGYGFLDLYHGHSVKIPKLYQKPYNTGFAFLLLYGTVVLYLFRAPRASPVEVAEDTTVYSGAYLVKYAALGVLGVFSLVFGAMWCGDYGEEPVAFRPLDYDLEKSRSPAMPRSAV